jgi:serine/threonine protein kinase
MAPEVIKNHNYTEKADVYSFAIILWELYNQEPPYDKLDKFEVAKKVANDPSFRPTVKENLPSKIKKLMIKCWDHDPNERPSFEAIIDYLDNLRRERSS